MRRIQIICDCHNLVEVVDKRIVEHRVSADGEVCSRSGDKYVSLRSSAPRELTSPTGNRMELVAEAEIPCPNCNEHSVGHAALYHEIPSEHRAEPISPKEYPTWTGPVSGVVN